MTRPRAILWTAVSTKAQAEDDKASLPAQEADLRALADKQGWQVIDTLRVPGHSRNYLEWHELVRDSLAEGTDAFYRLDQHLKDRDFDFLAVRDGDRFARTQTLHAFIVESVCIRAGAKIWSLADGQIDIQTARMYTAMGGYRAAGDNDRLQKYRKDAYLVKPQQGLAITGKALWSHKIIRNEVGKAVGYVIDESRRRAFDDLAELILSGRSWELIAAEMTRRGHRTKRGDPIRKAFIFTRVYHPTWWGHAALGVYGEKKTQQLGDWAFDEDAPIPEGTRVWRNVYPAVWTGELAEAIKAEIRRRHTIMKGKATSENTRRFSGLIICARCGFTMSSTKAKRWLGLDCRHRYRGHGCTQEKCISERNIVDFLTPVLYELKKSGDPELVFGGQGSAAVQVQLERARAELAEIRAQVRAMARLYAAAAGTVLEKDYAEELAALETRAAEIDRVIISYEASSSREQPRQAVLEELDVDGFWKQPSRVVNQTLHGLFGQWRLVADNGEIVGYAKVTRKSQHARKR